MNGSKRAARKRLEVDVTDGYHGADIPGDRDVATMTKASYAELLRDPRWVLLSNQIKDRAGRKCEECGTDSVRLNTHHTYYTRDLKPWEYPPESLRCWCEDCHLNYHDLKKQVDELISKLGFEALQILKTAASHLSTMQRFKDRDGSPDGRFLNEMLAGLSQKWGV